MLECISRGYIEFNLNELHFIQDTPQVLSNGFFHGYNTLVISVILLQAVGGLVVAVVVKYADNILKGFAASFSIITSLLLCYFILHDFEPTFAFLTGALLVNLSMYLYSYTPPSGETSPLTSSLSSSTLTQQGGLSVGAPGRQKEQI
jgi:UDP-sugar transporter A1/2/3